MGQYAAYEPGKRGRSDLSVFVRTALGSDATRIAEIQARRHDEDPAEIVDRIEGDLRQLEASKAQRSYCCVATLDGQVAGFGKCAYLDWRPRKEDSPPAGWYLTGVVVEPECRRRGVARALTRHRLDWLQARAATVYYWVDEVNRASIDLHRDFGFEEVERGLALSRHHNVEPQALFRLDLS